MSGITLATAQAHLDTWLAAETQVAGGQSVAFDGRALTRANLSEIRQQIDYWSRHVQRLTRGGAGVSVQRLIVHG
jgi:hypothetical protein